MSTDRVPKPDHPHWLQPIALQACLAYVLCMQIGVQLHAQDAFDSDDLDPFDAKPSKTKESVAKRIEPANEYEKGLKLSQIHKRPMLVVLGAEWCNWCRKLESDLATEEANEILEKWIIAKVDVEEEADIAREMQASALPALRVLGVEREVSASREGYLSIAELKEWLQENHLLADPTIQRVLYESGKLTNDDLKKLVEFLGHRSASIRTAAQKRLTQARNDSEGLVVDALRVGRLAQQLCALQILQSWKAPVATVDPWRPGTINTEITETLVQWLRRARDKDGALVANDAAAMPLNEAKVVELMARLLSKHNDKRDGVMAEAVNFGDALVPEVRMRLANTGAIDDSERTVLRELLYRLLVGDRMRLEKPMLLAALSSFNAETHRTAALNLLASVTSQDQPMVDELSQDADPLVREMTVSKLQELGELQKSERLQRLLEDKSPSVRTAVLRQLSEHPQDTSIAKLIEYTDRETDEDLLVYATKTLGLLGSQAGADGALIRLAKNVSWRVRAAALDAMGQVFEKQDHHYGVHKPSKASAESTTEMAKVILEAAEDSDEFVVERAVAMIPKIVDEESAHSVLEFFAKNPKRLSSLDKVLSEWRADEKLKPLINAAELWLENKEMEKVESAVIILTKIKPSALKLRIPSLLDSDNQHVRIGALHAAIASFAELRDESLKPSAVAIANPWFKSNTRKPWHAVPESLQAFPKATVESHESTAAELLGEVDIVMLEEKLPVQVAGLELLDDFFGAVTKTAEPKLVESDVEQKPSTVDAVDEVLSLFGDLSARKTAQSESLEKRPTVGLDDFFGTLEKADITDSTDTTAITAITATTESAESATGVELPSEWLGRWQNAYKFDWRSDWALEIRKKLQESSTATTEPTEKASSAERELIGFARLASGQALDASLALEHLRLRPLQEKGRGVEPQLKLKDMVAWLPAKERVEYVNSIPFEWRELSKKNGAEFLEAATIIDEVAIADWIFEGVKDCELSDVQWAMVRKYLLRALLGARADSVSYYYSASEVRNGDVYSQFKLSLPRLEPAVDWLSTHYKMEANDATKGMLLSALSYLDHGLAVQSAIGHVTEATQWSMSVRVALAIALWDQNETSVDRAVQWLDHPLLEVKHASLIRITQKVSDSAQSNGDLQTMVYWDYKDKMPGLWYVQRPMPENALRELAQSDESLAWRAKLLLLAAGKWSIQQLGIDAENSIERFRIAVALVKAGRTDLEAVAFYNKSVDQLMEDEEVGQFYRLMRALESDEIATIRLTMRKRFRASALRN